MTFDQWLDAQVTAAKDRGEHTTRRAMCKQVADASGVSLQTLMPVASGMRMGLYEKARAISAATGWAVTIPELCGDKAITPEIEKQFRALAVIVQGAT